MGTARAATSEGGSEPGLRRSEEEAVTCTWQSMRPGRTSRPRQSSERGPSPPALAAGAAAASARTMPSSTTMSVGSDTRASHRGAPSPSAPSTRSTTRAFRSTSGSPFVGVPGAAARCGDSEGCASLLILGMDVPRPR